MEAPPDTTRTGTATKLRREDWIRAALIRLATSGVEAVRVEALARDLGATKGSFYWHFKDRRELLMAVLGEWEAGTDRIIGMAGLEVTPSDRVERFVQLITRSVSSPEAVALEIAILGWAQNDPATADRVAAVEAKRIGNAARLLEETGIPESEAAVWADIGYTTCIGMMSRATRDRGSGRVPRTDYLHRILRAAELFSGQASE